MGKTNKKNKSIQKCHCPFRSRWLQIRTERNWLRHYSKKHSYHFVIVTLSKASEMWRRFICSHSLSARQVLNIAVIIAVKRHDSVMRHFVGQALLQDSDICIYGIIWVTASGITLIVFYINDNEYASNCPFYWVLFLLTHKQTCNLNKKSQLNVSLVSDSWQR